MERSGFFLTIFVLLVAGMSYFLAVFAYISPPVVALEVMRDLSLDPDTTGLMFSATMLVYAIMQPISGFCSDRFGARACLVFATATLGIGFIFFSQAQGLFTGSLARAIIGLASGITLIPCLKLAGNWLGCQYFGLASSSVIALGALGISISGRPLAVLTADLGWRDSFLYIGIATLIWVLLILVVVRDNPKGLPLGQKEPTPQEEHSPPPPFLTVGRTILSMPSFWFFSFLYIGTDLIYCTISGLWLGPYLVEVYGLTKSVVGNMITMSAISYFVGPPLLALWAGRWSYPKVIFTVVVINAALALFFVLSPNVPGEWVLYLLCFFAPIGAQLTGLYLAMVRDLVPRSIGASAMGFLNGMPLLGGALMQQLVGLLLTVDENATTIPTFKELYGQAFFPIFAFTVLSVVLAFFLMRRGWEWKSASK